MATRLTIGVVNPLPFQTESAPMVQGPARSCALQGFPLVRCGALLMAALFTPAAFAGAVLVPAGDLALRQDLEWLNDRGVLRLSTSSWPLPLAAVEGALEAVSGEPDDRAERVRLAQVRRSVARLSAPAPLIDAGYRSKQYALPHGFADDPRGEQELSMQSTLAGGAFAATLRGNAVRDGDDGDDKQLNVDGSYIAATALGQIVSVGKIDRYWGPAHEGSTLLGNAARPVAAVALQRATQEASPFWLLSWLGPWDYQLFFGQQDDYAAVPHTKLVGMRVTLQPLSGFEIGLHRTMQYGGKGRPQSLSSFWDALVGHSNTTSSGSVTIANDPANQLGGVDLRWSRPFGLTGVALYAQLTGEDEAGGLPSRNTINAGLAYGAAIGDTALTFRLESADTRTDRFWGARGVEPNRTGYTYTNGIYTGGYYELGQPLGYPIGGDGQLYKFGVEAATVSGLRYGVDAYHLKLNPLAQPVNGAYPAADTVDAASVSVSYPIRFLTLSARLAVQDSDLLGSDVTGIAGIRFDLGDL